MGREADSRQCPSPPGARRALARQLLVLGVLGVAWHGAWAGEHGHQRAAQTQKQEPAPEPRPATDSFDPNAVNQSVTRTAVGGIRRVVANESSDAIQIGRIRASLKALADAFGPASFAAPAAARAPMTPAVAKLRSAAAGQLRAQYLEIRGGGEIRYIAEDAELIGALHAWLDEPWPQAASASLPTSDASAFPHGTR